MVAESYKVVGMVCYALLNIEEIVQKYNSDYQLVMFCLHTLYIKSTNLVDFIKNVCIFALFVQLALATISIHLNKNMKKSYYQINRRSVHGNTDLIHLYCLSIRMRMCL